MSKLMTKDQLDMGQLRHSYVLIAANVSLNTLFYFMYFTASGADAAGSVGE